MVLPVGPHVQLIVAVEVVLVCPVADLDAVTQQTFDAGIAFRIVSGAIISTPAFLRPPALD